MILDRKHCSDYLARNERKPAISRDALAVGLIFLFGLASAAMLAWLMSWL